MIKTKRGLDLPINGSPKQTIEDGPRIRQVALVGYDYPGMKPTMEVREGDQVKAGQLIFTDKKTPGVKFTAPASGKVVAINRGQKRVFESLVVEVDPDAETETFVAYPAAQLRTLERGKVLRTSSKVASGQQFGPGLTARYRNQMRRHPAHCLSLHQTQGHFAPTPLSL